MMYVVCVKENDKGKVETTRSELEKMLEAQVNLKLWVKVKKDWRDSDFLIRNFGYDKKEI